MSLARHSLRRGRAQDKHARQRVHFSVPLQRSCEEKSVLLAILEPIPRVCAATVRRSVRRCKLTRLDPALKALGFKSLKVQCFQAVGFTYQPAPLQLGSARDAATLLPWYVRVYKSLTLSLPFGILLHVSLAFRHCLSCTVANTTGL